MTCIQIIESRIIELKNKHNFFSSSSISIQNQKKNSDVGSVSNRQEKQLRRAIAQVISARTTPLQLSKGFAGPPTFKSIIFVTGNSFDV